MPDGKEGDLGRERYKDFTFDYSYWSYSKADPHYASQEQVIWRDCQWILQVISNDRSYLIKFWFSGVWRLRYRCD